jgi:hypothetical protein
MHDPENLTVLCRRCHSWYHAQTSPDEVPFELTEDDLAELLPKDVEILRILSESGPMKTGAITSAHSVEMSAATVRERLHVLMGLDNKVASRDRQLVDQDADTGEWGLAVQITNSARGRIPTDPQTLLQRAQDEYVRQALDRGVDRESIMSMLDISERSTFYKANRARAFDFPLNAIDKRNGGRPAAADDGSECSDVASDAAQQQLDAVADGGDNRAAGASTDTDEGAQENCQGPNEDNPDVQEFLQQAIAALRSLDEAL